MLPDYRALPEFANRNTHATAYDLLAAELGEIAGKRIVDLPCGAGAFSVRLAAHGALPLPFDIVCHDPFYYYREALTLADANRGIPLREESVDAVVSIEGVEHFENPVYFLRECARVLKPAGVAIVSTPNVDSLRSRRSVLLKGYPRFFEPVASDEKASGHQLPIDMVYFRGAAKRAGLSIVRVAVNRPGPAWLAGPLAALFARRLPAEMRGAIPLFGDVVLYALRKTRRL